jgi:Na+/H+ antiporter NhaD/arsenite permease-like protein
VKGLAMASAIICTFVCGYIAIAFEHVIRINKAAIALLTGVFCWTIYIVVSQDHHIVAAQLTEHMGEIAGILFFLMGAMTIVELIDMHSGFDVITSRIRVNSKRQLLWVIGILTFFLSAVLDNLTTTIVVISLLTKFTLEQEERLLFAGIVVIAANSGGAWSPIGDVTTTMLWIDGRITTGGIILKLFIPSLISAIVPLIIASFMVQGTFCINNDKIESELNQKAIRDRNIVLFFGIGALLFVPVFKTLTHLPPFMGMLFSLGLLWLLTEIIHANKEAAEKRTYSAVHALTRIDMPSVLFFLGILTSISALEVTGLLKSLSLWLDKTIGNVTVINLIIGFASAVVDNVPLVAGAVGIYSIERFAVDHHFWIFLSYCAGVGGSALIIGSAAGIAAMGIAKIEFMWYLKKITPLAVSGYLAGAGVYLIQYLLIK